MTKHKILTTAIWFLWVLLPAFAQEYIANVQYFDVEDGLSHREVNAVYQDSRGFIWLGTKTGLNRFDGYEFKWWTKEKDGLISNDIREIEEDAEGYLWIFPAYRDLWSGRVNDITLLHPEKGIVTSFQQKFGTPPGFEINELTNCLSDQTGRLFWTTLTRPVLISYHPSEGYRVKKLPGINKFELNTITSKQRIWITADTFRLIEMDYDGKIIKEYQHDGILYENMRIPENSDAFYFTERRMDETIGNTFFFDREGEKHDFFPYRWIKDLNPKSPEDWIFIRHPLTNAIWTIPYIIIPGQELLFDLKTQPGFKENLGNRSYIFDNHGRRWIGGNYGLELVEFNKSKFSKYLYNPETVTDKSVRGMVEKDGKLYINQETDLADQSHSPLTLDLKLGKVESLWQEQYTNWGYREIMAENQYIWTAFLNTIIKYDPQSGQHKKLAKETQNPIWAMYKISRQQILFGSRTGLGVIDIETETHQPYKGYNNFKELALAHVIDILPERNGNLWICTNNGLYLMNPEKGVQKRFWSGGKEAFFLPCDDIHHLHQDGQGVFWLATNGCGLIRWEGGDASFSNSKNPEGSPEEIPLNKIKEGDYPVKDGDQLWHQFTRLDGLSNDVIYAIYEDDHQNLWMSSDYGIMQFDKQTFQVNTYLEQDGITHHEFNRISHYKGNDGTIYFGGLNGITAFQPDDFYDESNIIQPELQITAFQQFDGEKNQLVNNVADINSFNKIILQPDDRFFLLEFALLTYKDVDKIRYAWKIEGVDENWNYQKERSIRLSRLPYGTYYLRVKGQAANGQWSENELNIEMEVVKPFYLKSWFILIALLGILGGAVAFYKWRTWQYKKTQKTLQLEVEKQTAAVRKQAEELRQLDKLKSRFFANVSHELRTPLTLVLGPLNTVLKRKRLENKDFTLLKLMQKNGQSLLRLIGEILDLSKLESGKLDLKEEPVLLLPFVKRLIAQFESLAQQRGIRFIFEGQPDPYLQILLDGDKFEKVINNLLSNALKFTAPSGTVSVVLKDFGNVISFRVNDTGLGIHPDDLPHVFERFYQSKQADAPTQGGTGIGLALCREYANLFGGNISVVSAVGKGSTFIFEFPKKEVMGVAEIPVLESVPKILSLGTEPVPFGLPTNGSPDGLAPTILVVEDNPDLSQYVQQILSEHYHVLTAENGQVALERLTAGGIDQSNSSTIHRPPDLIISDVMMPVMDGFQFLEKVKSDDRWRHIPVVMLTARAGLQDRLKALRIGVDDYMLKPFEEEELLLRVQNLLTNAQERKNWSQKETDEQAPDSTISKAVETDTSPAITGEEAQWLEQLEAIALKNAGNFELTADFLAAEIFTSRTNLFRRVKKLSGLTFTQYIREIRMQQARRLLESRSCQSVKAAAYAVGYKQVDWFSQNFKTHFGKLPSAYL